MDVKRRVVITGMGAVSSIGTGLEEIERSLRAGRSGLTHVPSWEELGLASQVAGFPEAEPDSPLITRKSLKSSTSTALMAMSASSDALESANLELDAIRGTRMAVLIGSGTGSNLTLYKACDHVREKKSSRRLSPFTVPKVMGSTASANVSVALGLRGESWSISSACSTGSHSIGLGATLIRCGLYECLLAGASEELDWTRTAAFDAMHALSRGYNDRPEAASRPFDAARDGFVISGGAGVVVLESLESARRRQAPIWAEVVGYAATSDGHDIVAPHPPGAIETMQMALADANLAPGEVDYVNAHGTSTPQGDPSEALAMKEVFGQRQPWISSTKSTTGHAIGAAGSLELIYTTLMLKKGFLAPNQNLETLDEACTHLRPVVESNNQLDSRVALSNSFGFGGTNACLVIRRWDDA